ncbi:MAG: hypothetical protein QGI13_14965 [Rhodospirillales bacterium]|jgi:Asp-tRNA(Asn)/Glu-tRNA(Gln) amidotransferase A subunit family amidase|nr:hypothetical protein [Rhodospirillales bacterium]
MSLPTLPPDPCEPGGIAGFAERLRAGATTAEAATEAYLDRIEILEPRLEVASPVWTVLRVC